jgi:hypothetical protein
VHIDDVIGFLQEKLRVLFSRRNTLALIHRLPSEVLVKIFSLIINQAVFRFKTLTNIASVCSYWRSLIINDPLSWSNISVKHPSAIKCMLQRSKLAPISISITLTASPSKAFITEVMSHLHRMTSLIVATEDHDCLASVTEVLQREQAPLLRSFSLYNYSGITQGPLPCNAPKLDSLDLLDWILPIQPTTYAHNLRKLTIHREDYTLRDIRLSELLDVLSAATKLEELDLEDPFYTLDDHPLSSDPRIVPMENLSKFRLQESISLTTAFLEHITVTPHTSLDLRIDLDILPEESVEECVQTFASTILPWLQSRGADKYRTLILSEDHSADDLIFDFSPSLEFEWPAPEITRIQVSNAQIDNGDSRATILGMRAIISQLGPHELGVDDVADAMLISLRYYSSVKRLALLGFEFGRCLWALRDLDFVGRLSVLRGIETVILREVDLSVGLAVGLADVLDGIDVREVVIERSRGVTVKVLDTLREGIKMVTWDGQNLIRG